MNGFSPNLLFWDAVHLLPSSWAFIFRSSNTELLLGHRQEIRETRMSDTVHPLCSLALYSGTPALIGVSLGLAAFSCYWNTVSLSPPLILCTDFFNVPSPLLFCSSYSCSHLFLRVLQSKFEKGVGVVRWGARPWAGSAG